MEEHNTNDAVQVYEKTAMPAQMSYGGHSKDTWEIVQRMAQAYSTSDIVPAAYKGKVANCIIALEMANRMGADPMMIMQSLYIVHGNPGWSSKFLIATFNQCGRFTSIRYEWNKDRTSCRAWSTEKATNERVEGIEVTMAMAQAEGWSTKAGSKWKTMPELMLQYRASAFLIRTCAPELSMGLQTVEEVQDVEVIRSTPIPKTIRWSVNQMEAAKYEVEQMGKSTAEEILEANPNLPEDQRVVIASWEYKAEQA